MSASMKARKIAAVFVAVLLLLVGCGRQTAQTSGDKIPAELIEQAGGKAAFVEFYSPT